MNRYLTAPALALLLGVAACDNKNNANNTPPPDSSAMAPSTPAETTAPTAASIDSSFVETATIAGLFEVESSKLALTKASDPALKAFAQMMIDDHTKANAELKSLIEGGSVKGITNVPGDLDGAHQTKMAELNALSGAAFDAKYHAAQLDGHKEAVTLFEGESMGGQDPALKDWAAQTLPRLKEHLTKIQEISVPSP